MSGKLPGTTQAQHMFGVLPSALVTYAGLAGKERLKTFPLQIIKNSDGRYPGISVTAGFVFILTKNTGDVLH